MVDVHRVVADPRQPLAALAELVDDPADLEELLALRAMTDPLASDALQAVSLVAPADRYVGYRAAIVMAPFLTLGPSRFSPGTYGVLYTADALLVAIGESAYHAGRYLHAAHVTTTTVVPRFAFHLSLDDRDHRDIRREGAHDLGNAAIYDPVNYGVAQAVGAELRAAGHDGVWYDSVRSPGGTCFGTFRPAAIADVRDTARELELVWDGARITEYRAITTHPL